MVPSNEQDAAMPHLEEKTGWALFYQKRFNIIWGFVSVALFLAAWEIAVKLGLMRVIFTSYPSQIFVYLLDYVSTRAIIDDLSVSASEYLIGLGLAVLVGIPLGTVTGWYKFAYAVTTPFTSALYVTPSISFLPLVIIWVGVGIGSKVVVVFLGGLFPILYNTQAAFSALDPELLQVARSYRATDLQIFRTVALPSSLPIVLTGFRLAAGHCLASMVVVEFWAAFAGIGYKISRAGGTFRTGEMFVGILIVAFLGITLTELARLLERHFDSWRVTHGSS